MTGTPHYEGLAVKYGTLDALATELGNLAKQLESDLTALKKGVHDAAEGWAGEAYEAFNRKSREWDNHTSAIHQALVSITHKVHQAGGDYRGGDKKAASYFE
ncbi:WXG100 family type VII secretion target [Streptomyces sp. NPDC046197]|uniref:WXG100 family type VII secretion target n=1 Tax=Streptomyces sp. NPDC046197 TaxID=3154337 RepID=UPI003401C025